MSDFLERVKDIDDSFVLKSVSMSLEYVLKHIESENFQSCMISPDGDALVVDTIWDKRVMVDPNFESTLGDFRELVKKRPLKTIEHYSDYVIGSMTIADIVISPANKIIFIL